MSKRGKSTFWEQEFRSFLAEKGYLLSSANSINWGRLVPQIVYYVFAYLNLVSGGGIDFGQAINIVVPTGNFGNILAAWYAAQMGVPVGKLICASNENKVLMIFIVVFIIASVPLSKRLVPLWISLFQ